MDALDSGPQDPEISYRMTGDIHLCEPYQFVTDVLDLVLVQPPVFVGLSGIRDDSRIIVPNRVVSLQLGWKSQ